jgi:hypothetical protein
MVLDKKYYIHTGKDGSLEAADLDTSSADVDALLAGLANVPKVALNIHGGLIDKERALATAQQLAPFYLEAGIYPIFLVWETGLLKTLENLLQDVWNEGLFKSLVQKVLRHAASKLAGSVLVGARDARGLPALPDEVEVTREYQKLRKNTEPFAAVVPKPGLTPLSKTEIERFEEDLNLDPTFPKEAEAAARWLDQQAQPQGAVARLPGGPAHKTLADPDKFFETTPPGTKGERGLFSAAKAIKHAVEVLIRVVRRYVEGRDHGLYATVVEEVLRQFYFTNVGAAVWGTMKRQASATFEGAGQAPVRGGWYLTQRLGALLKSGASPEISVVAHSAGAIYACHMLRHIQAARGSILPAGFAFKHLLLMAPACDFGLFQSVANLQPPLFEHFRMFALKDTLESGYWEVPVIYPRSLLYLVSGAFEIEADGSTGAYDLPLLGMERYLTGATIYGQPEIVGARQFLGAAGPSRQVWAISDGGDGLAADSHKHGEFWLDRDEKPSQAMRSAVYLLQHGS